MIRVAVVDDQTLVRAGFCGIIAATEGLTVVGEAADGAAAVAMCAREKPDIVLMDVRMPVLDGVEATRWITGDPATQGVRVIILTTFDLDEYVYGALRAGASGFLLKDTLPVDLISAIKVVAAGDALLAPSITRRVISQFATGPQRSPAPPVLEMLTDREREVLRLVASGLSNAEIAQRLYISPATTKTHVAHLLTKLDARDRIQLVIVAYESGLAVPRSAPS
jgi:DNA-binding NarL/FixJ family response regulator